MLTSNQKGQIAVSKAQVRAIELGYNPSIPVMDCRYDLVIDDGKRLWRVQVKSTNRVVSHCSGAVSVNLTYETRHRHKIYTYSDLEVDVLVVYLPKLDKLCWFPTQVFANKTALNIRLEALLNRQKSGIIYAKDGLKGKNSW